MRTDDAKAILTLAFGLAVTAAYAQAQPPAPREHPSVTLNGKKLTIDYGRPSLNGRTLDALTSQLKADRVWRAGQNQVTTLDTEGALTIAGKKVAAGKYSLYLTLPESGSWNLLLNTNPGIPLKEIYAAAKPEVANELWPRLDGYDKVLATEVLRVPLKKAAAPATPAEKFLITLDPPKGGATAITFTWGDQSWTTDIQAAK